MSQLSPDHLVHLELARAAEAEPDAPYARFVGLETLARGELLRRVRAVASGLEEHGVHKGDRVALMLSNRSEFLDAWFACAALGAIVVPLNTALRGDILGYMLQQTEPQAVVVEADFAANLASVPAAFVRARVVDVDDDPEAFELFADQRIPYTQLTSASGVWDFADVSPWDPFSIMYTSGTTGRSKGVVWTHQTALRLAEGAAHYLQFTPEDVVHTTLPLFHGNALALSTFGALVARAQVAIGHRFSASGFWHEVKEVGATVTSLLGSMAQMLWHQPRNLVEREHRLRLAMVIPGPPGDQYERFEERYGLRMTEAYGLTDVGMVLWVPPGERRPGSCGQPTVGWEVQVVDEHDQPVPAGTVGELVARPTEPYIAPLGYWQMPDATNAARRNLWMHTGDLMVVDESGWYHFVDRAKDAIRRRGENVSAFEVEQVLQAHPTVAECAVYAVPSDVMEDEVMAAVVPEPGRSLTAEELMAHCERRLPYFAIPRYIRIMEELPRTSTAKVMKKQLRDEAVTDDTWDRDQEGCQVAR